MADALGSGAAAAAWYVDPTNPAQWRWWDGAQWTDHVTEMRPAEPGQGTQATAEATPAAVAAAEQATRWPVPPADAPLVPRTGYSKLAHPSVRKAFDKAMLARLPYLIAIGLGSVVVMAIGVALLRMTADVLVYGTQMWRRAVHGIRVQSRAEPWRTAFRSRGLVTAAGLPGRCGSMPVVGAASVSSIWGMRGELRGLDATCGELVLEHLINEGDAERWRWLTFAAFEIPPRAADRHRSVSVRQKRLLGIGGLAPSGRQVRLESIAVDQSLVIKVDERVDDVTVRELFGPQLVAALADYPVSWDQRGRWLLVFQPSPAEPIVEFDAFLSTATAVARAYWMDQE